MAERSKTITAIPTSPGYAWVVSWEGLLNGDTGAALEMSGWADRSVQVIGTFDTSTLTVQGSNDGATWATLHDPQGSNLAFTSAGIKAVAEAVRYIRPSSAGGASTDLDVFILISGPRII